MKRLFASSCMAALAMGTTAAAAQEVEISREVVDAFVTGETIVDEGAGSAGDCEETAEEEYLRTGVEVICSERDTFLILNGNSSSGNNRASRATPTPTPAASRPRTARRSTPAAPRQPRRVAIPARCAPSQNDALNMCLTFGLGSSTLTSAARDQIKVFAESMLANQSDQSFVIAGHTDTSGTETRNCELSRARAESVVAYMVDLGVNASQLQPVGYGQTRLQDGVSATDARNRRVEIVRGSADGEMGQSCSAGTEQADTAAS